MSGYQEENLPIPTPARLRREFLLGPPPPLLVSVLVIITALALALLALIWHARVAHSPQPRIQLMQDMGIQPRYGPQAASDLFADGRADRPPVPGAVAWEMPAGEDHYERGYELVPGADGQPVVRYFTGLPARVTVDQRLMERGRTIFNIYCATCHGRDGYGNGAINQRATDKQEAKWVPPSNLHAIANAAGQLQLGAELYPDGKLFNTIRYGIRTMPGYGSQIATPDRWAVVAYVRALQRSQHAKIADVPMEEREKMR